MCTVIYRSWQPRKDTGIECADLTSLASNLPKLCENELTKGVVLELCNIVMMIITRGMICTHGLSI